MSRGRRLLRGAALVLLGAVTALASARPATATTLLPGSPGRERTIELRGGSSQVAPLSVDRLAPGSTASQAFRLHLSSSLVAGRPAMEIANIRDFERGCNHPETAAGDVTCGPGDDQGELSSQLLVGVTWQPLVAGRCPRAGGDRATTTMAAAAGVMQPDVSGTADGVDTCMLLTLTLPLSADNLVQSDAVQFDLRVGLLDAVHRGDLAAARGDTDALITGHTGGAGSSARSSVGDTSLDVRDTDRALPFTGRRVLPLMLLGLGLLALGSLMSSSGRLRQDMGAKPPR